MGDLAFEWKFKFARALRSTPRHAAELHSCGVLAAIPPLFNFKTFFNISKFCIALFNKNNWLRIGQQEHIKHECKRQRKDNT